MRDKQNLQREQKKGVSGSLWAVAYAAVLAIYLALLGLIAWGLLRVEDRLRPGGRRPPAARTEPVAAPARPSPA